MRCCWHHWVLWLCFCFAVLCIVSWVEVGRVEVMIVHCWMIYVSGVCDIGHLGYGCRVEEGIGGIFNQLMIALWYIIRRLVYACNFVFV